MDPLAAMNTQIRMKTAKHFTGRSFITQTRLFKYIENFTTKNWKFSDKNSDSFHIST